ncbi:hypothetical protein L596_012142 [Steinernema carpocapsae]|uniref:Dynein assembly factor 1, axonemal homolog n=1 Tax=Steinernema carpocapsae TaxID=34508 RepID=A0A4U5NW57_STECR|nr:hypothetical protein L596_012142 [Steinernema carpocapsae]
MLIQAHIRPTAPVFSHAFKRQTRAVAMLSSAKITSTVTHLKTRYYKYLENLCAANGIELAALKNESQEHERLEMFFTGLPVLVGLKYFTHLRCLRLVGQDITNLRPLGDVADSLEELWVCEGVLSDISGIEQCHRLQRIYAFDNKISSGAPLEALTDLKELWIQDNCLTDLSFLHSLSNLNVLKIGGKQLSDMTIRTVLEWPGKLQTLNATSDSRKSLQSLIPLEECSMLRKVNLGGDSEGYFMWIGCHFPFLEYLDDDKLEDKFVPFYLVSFLWSNEF